MKCRDCKAEQKTSKLYFDFPAIFLTNYVIDAAECIRFYDEEGQMHTHDSKPATIHYHCSNDHDYTITDSPTCWCGWHAPLLVPVDVDNKYAMLPLEFVHEDHGSDEMGRRAELNYVVDATGKRVL